MPTNIVLQSILRGPQNIPQVLSDIRRQIEPRLTLNIKPVIDDSSIKQMTSQTGQLNNALQNNIREFSNLGNAGQEAGRKLKGASQELSHIEQLARQMSGSLRDVSLSMRQAADGAYAFGEQTGLATRRFLAFSVGVGGILGSLYAFKQGISDAINFQGEMVRLAQVSNDTSTQIKSVATEITRLATTYGTSSAELSRVAVNIRQAGFSARETATVLETLAQAALSPNFDSMEKNVEGAIAIMSQFQVKAEDLKQSFSSINAVAAQYAVSAKDIQDAVTRSGGAFASAGGDLNQFISLFTSIKHVTQESSESIATGLRNIFTRLQSRDTIDSLRAMGIQLRYTAQEAQALGSVNLTGQFVKPLEAINRIQSALRGLSSTDQRFLDITQAIGGTKNISRALPLIQQGNIQRNALDTAQNAGGNLGATAEIGLQKLSTQGKIVYETFEKFYRLVTDSTGFQELAKSLLTVAEAFGFVLKFAAPVIPLLLTLSTIPVAQKAQPFISGFLNRVTQPHLTGPTRYAAGGYAAGGPSLLTPGEIVYQPDQARQIGYNNLHKANSNGFVVPGVGNQDSELFNLQPGSFVVKQSSAKKIGAGQLSKFADGGETGGGTWSYRDESKLPDSLSHAIKSGFVKLDGGEWVAGMNTPNAIVADSPEDAYSSYLKNWFTEKLNTRRFDKFGPKLNVGKFADGGLFPSVTPYSTKDLNELINKHKKDPYTQFLLNGIREDEAHQFIPEGSELLGTGIAGAAFRKPTGNVLRLQPFLGQRPFATNELPSDVAYISQRIAAQRGLNKNYEPYEREKFSYQRPPIESVLQNLGKKVQGNTLIEELPFISQYAPSTSDKYTLPEHLFENLTYRLGADGYKSSDLKPDNIGLHEGVYKLIDVGGLKPIHFTEKNYYQEKLAKQIQAANEKTQIKLSGGGILSSIGGFFKNFFSKNTKPQLPNANTVKELIAQLPQQEIQADAGIENISPVQSADFFKMSYVHNVRKAKKLLEEVGIHKDASLFDTDLSNHPELKNLGVKDPNQLGIHLDKVDAYLSQASVFAGKAGFDTATENIFKKLGETASLRQKVDEFHSIPTVDAQVLPEGFGRKGQKQNILNYMGKMLGAGADKDNIQKEASNIFGIAGSTAYKYFLQAKKAHLTTGQDDLDFSLTVDDYDKFIGKPQKFANGGISPKDTIPALLTPGEFVFSPEATSRIGVANLDRANKTGDVSHIRGYNRGGVVGYASGDLTKKPSEEELLQQAIELLAKKTGLDFSSLKDITQFKDKVESERRPGKFAQAQYNPRTKQISLSREHNSTVEEIASNLLHEATHRADIEQGGGDKYSSYQGGTVANKLVSELEPKIRQILASTYNQPSQIERAASTNKEVLAHGVQGSIFPPGTQQPADSAIQQAIQDFLSKTYPKIRRPLTPLPPELAPPVNILDRIEQPETENLPQSLFETRNRRKRIRPLNTKYPYAQDVYKDSKISLEPEPEPTNTTEQEKILKQIEEDDYNNFLKEKRNKERIQQQRINKRLKTDKVFQKYINPPLEPTIDINAPYDPNAGSGPSYDLKAITREIKGRATSGTGAGLGSQYDIGTGTSQQEILGALVALKNNPFKKSSPESGEYNRAQAEILAKYTSIDNPSDPLSAQKLFQNASGMSSRQTKRVFDSIAQRRQEEAEAQQYKYPRNDLRNPSINQEPDTIPFSETGNNPSQSVPLRFRRSDILNSASNSGVQFGPQGYRPLGNSVTDDYTVQKYAPGRAPFNPNFRNDQFSESPFATSLPDSIRVTDKKQSELEKFYALQIESERRNLTAGEKSAAISVKIAEYKDKLFKIEENKLAITNVEKILIELRKRGLDDNSPQLVNGQSNLKTYNDYQLQLAQKKQAALEFDKSVAITSNKAGAITSVGGTTAGIGFFGNLLGKGFDSDANAARFQGGLTTALLTANLAGDSLSQFAGTSDEAVRYGGRGAFRTGRTLQSAAIYAGIGASVGSIIPGAGTVAGGLIGAGIGAVGGGLSAYNSAGKELDLSAINLQVERTTNAFNSLIESVDRLGARLNDTEISQASRLIGQRVASQGESFDRSRSGFSSELGFAASALSSIPYVGLDNVGSGFSRFISSQNAEARRTQFASYAMQRDPTLTTGINRVAQGVIDNSVDRNRNIPLSTIQSRIREAIPDADARNVFATGRGFDHTRGGFEAYLNSPEFRSTVTQSQQRSISSGLQNELGFLPLGLRRFTDELTHTASAINKFGSNINNIAAIALGGTSISNSNIDTSVLSRPLNTVAYKQTVGQITNDLPEFAREQFSNTALHIGRVGSVGERSIQEYLGRLTPEQQNQPNFNNQLSTILNTRTGVNANSREGLLNEQIARQLTSSPQQLANFRVNPEQAQEAINRVLAQFQGLSELGNVQNTINQQITNAYNQILQISLRRVEYIGRAADNESELVKITQQQSSIRRFGNADVLLDESGYQNNTRGFNARINTLGQGNFNSNTSVQDIIAQNRAASTSRDEADERLRTGRSTDRPADIRAVAGFTEAVVRSRQALELYANSNVQAAYRQEQLRQNAAERDSRISGARRFISGSDEDRADLVTGSALDRYVQGGGRTIEQQRESFNQLGLPEQQTLLRYQDTFANVRDTEGRTNTQRSNYFVSGDIEALNPLNQQQEAIVTELQRIFADQQTALGGLTSFLSSGEDAVRVELTRINNTRLEELTAATTNLARIQETRAASSAFVGPPLPPNYNAPLANTALTPAQITTGMQSLFPGMNVGANQYATGGLVYANQGFFQPQGTDTVPAMLTPGEMVVNRASTEANRDLLERINSSNGALRYYPIGGIVEAREEGERRSLANYLEVSGNNPVNVSGALSGSYNLNVSDTKKDNDIFNSKPLYKAAGGFLSQGVEAQYQIDERERENQEAQQRFRQRERNNAIARQTDLEGQERIHQLRRQPATGANPYNYTNPNPIIGDVPTELVGPRDRSLLEAVARSDPFSSVGFEYALEQGNARGAANLYQLGASQNLLRQQLLTQSRVSGGAFSGDLAASQRGQQVATLAAQAQRNRRYLTEQPSRAQNLQLLPNLQGDGQVQRLPSLAERRAASLLDQRRGRQRDAQELRDGNIETQHQINERERENREVQQRFRQRERDNNIPNTDDPYNLTGAGFGRGGTNPYARGFAIGGMVSGPTGIDNIPAYLSAGEYVMDRRTTQAYGANNLAQMQRFANGGLVGNTSNAGGVGGVGDSSELQQALLGFSEQSSVLANALMNFTQNNTELVEALRAFPQSISLEATHRVEVLHNGAEVFASLEGSFRDLVVAETDKAIKTMLKDKFPDVGA